MEKREPKPWVIYRPDNTWTLYAVWRSAGQITLQTVREGTGAVSL